MKLPKFTICIAGLLLALVGCATFPEFDAGIPIPASTEPVVLLPIDQLIAQANGGVADAGTAADLAARAARLRARAAASQ